jgi:hypothetical protein
LVVETLIAALLGSAILEEVSFTDLGGAGNAGVLADLVGSLDGYARRVVVIIDSEAKARPHVEALVESGGLPAADVLLFETSLEEENAADEDLVAPREGARCRSQVLSAARFGHGRAVVRGDGLV